MESSWLHIIFAVVLPQCVPIVEGMTIKNAIKTWYVKVNKPPWNPPNWIFGPVWTTLYTLMGYASYLVWREGELSESAEVHANVRCALTMYGIQLFLNWIWTPIYFNFRKVGLALLDFVVLLVAVVITIMEFYAVLPFAAYLLIPYLCWGLFAITVNGYIWLYNDFSDSKKK